MAHLPFDLRALEVFLAVCDARSMAGAARSLGVTQSAVSQTIAELEAACGVALIDRRIRPLGVTTAGSVLRQGASSVLHEARGIPPRLREAAAGRLPRVRVGIVESLARATLGPLARFLDRHAEQSSCLAGLTAWHAASLLGRELDLLIGVDALGEIPGLERFPLLEEPYLLLCPNTLAPPHAVGELAALLAATPLARFSARSRTGLDIERHLRRLRLEPPLRQEFDSPLGVLAAARSGAAAITTPFCLFEAGLELVGLACHPLPGPRFARTLTLVARKRELGRLPAQLAQTLHQTLQDDCLPRILSEMPRFAGQIRINPPS